MIKFLAFVRKEFIHIFRDPRTLVILFLMPIVLTMLFGFAITNDIKNARIAVFDSAKDSLSQGIIERLRVSEYFEVYEAANSIGEADDMLRRGEVKAVVVFPELLASRAAHDGSAQIKVLANASDPNETVNISGYIEAIAAQECAEKFGTMSDAPSITPIPNLLYNPQLKSAYNFVPGVMGLILFIICTLMTSVGIVREKEFGSMEVLLVSPVKPIYIIISKTVPYFVLSILIICVILVLAHFVLDVPIRGNLALLFGVSALYSLLALTLGVLVSTVSNTQHTAMFISAGFLMLPIVLLSGMVFPIENMPRILQVISDFVPAKWYISAIRDVMLKGGGFDLVKKDVLIMAVMTAACILASLLNFKKRMD